MFFFSYIFLYHKKIKKPLENIDRNDHNSCIKGILLEFPNFCNEKIKSKEIYPIHKNYTEKFPLADIFLICFALSLRTILASLISQIIWQKVQGLKFKCGCFWHR